MGTDYVTLSVAARRTGLAGSGRQMEELCRTRGVELMGRGVDLTVFAGRAVDVDLEMEFTLVAAGLD